MTDQDHSDALTGGNAATDALSQQTFLDQFRPGTDWAIGPFRREPGLDFELTGQWPDPLGVGWTSASIINPSMITHGDELHLFYRASPKKESLSSRIGHAVFTDDAGWVDTAANPIVHPTLNNEGLGVEDPKIYRTGDRYVLFYNAIFEVTDEDRRRHPSPDYPIESVGCDINVAESTDLITWTKRGPVTDHAITRLWAKGAVIPRDDHGNAVRIGGEYLMYLSEGCNGVPHVGRSADLITWTFRPQPYHELSPLDGHLHEVATAFVRGEDLVLDLFYSRGGVWSAAQARYRLDAPFTQLELNPGGTLAWGGLVRWRDRLTFAQGWDAAGNTRQLQFYVAPDL